MTQQDSLQWEKKTNYSWCSISTPQYTIAAYIIDKVIIYRATLRGSFTGGISTAPDDAKRICQNNFIIQGGVGEGLAGDESVMFNRDKQD